MKNYERILSAVEWYQNETYFNPLVCRDDGEKLIGRGHLGHVHLECPHCGLRHYEIPAHVDKLYCEAHDMPTIWRLEEAKALAEKLGRVVPESVVGSAVRLRQYINASKGKVIELGESHDINP